MNSNTNKIISLIYEAAITPSKWVELLSALSLLVEQCEIEAGLDQKCLLGNNDFDNKSNISISDALRAITNIDQTEIKKNNINIESVNDLLMDHFARAIKIAKRLVDMDDQHNVVLSLLDRMPIALVLVDKKARVIETNTLADELLSSNGELKITSNILNSGVESNKDLLDIIEKMSKRDPITTRGQSLFISNKETKNNIMVFVAPLKQHGTQHQTSVAVFISQRKSIHLSLPKEISDLYGLTKKELKVTEQLVYGLSIKDIAEDACISEHTVRVHVKSILKKTRTSRQAELVSLVYNELGGFVNSIPVEQTDKRSSLLNKTKPYNKNYKVLPLADDRTLAYSEYGDLNGEPVFHCHSIFGTRLELAFDAHKIAKQKSVHLIVLDRPGFGASDPKENANFINWSEDLIQLANHLNIEKFSLIGYIMGGMYALACAYKVPERVKRVALISNCMVPKSSSDYKYFIPFYRMNLRLAKYMPKVYGLISSILAKGALSDTDSFINQMSENLNPSDQAIMDSNGFKEQLIVNLKETFIQGSKASSQEVIQYMQSWPFELSEINTPIDIWVGASDCHQPPALGKRFAEHIKNNTLHIKKGHGHYMFYTHWAEILDELLN
ncbi:MAG: alpha/beta fold hydrolase [Woeseiaceae bacterium]